MTLLTLYTLFGDDVRVLSFSQSADVTFWIISSVSLFFFAVEIILASISKEEYLGGFYFWLDLVATISLFADIGWVWDAITGTGGSGGVANAGQAQAIAKAS